MCGLMLLQEVLSNQIPVHHVLVYVSKEPSVCLLASRVILAQLHGDVVCLPDLGGAVPRRQVESDQRDRVEGGVAKSETSGHPLVCRRSGH